VNDYAGVRQRLTVCGLSQPLFNRGGIWLCTGKPVHFFSCILFQIHHLHFTMQVLEFFHLIDWTRETDYVCDLLGLNERGDIFPLFIGELKLTKRRSRLVMSGLLSQPKTYFHVIM
jgi:hypothetical protein